MANSKIKILLKKIHSIVDDEETISRLEMDLVKSYLRDLYELTDTLGGTDNFVNGNEHAPVQDPVKMPPRVLERPKMESPESQPEAPALRKEPENEVPRAGQWREHNENSSNGREDIVKENLPTARSLEKSVSDIAMVKEVPEVFSRESLIPKKYAILFETSTTRELSEKLSRIPITDLHKCLGINDRMLVVADLFGGHQSAFNETMDILNTKYSFEEAKSYLVRYIIDRFEWLSEEKIERARDFIKLVERRYLNR